MIAYNTVPYSLKDMPNWVVWKYETRDGNMGRVNLELVTEHYRGRNVAEKARAGFSLYTPRGEGDKLRRVLDQQELTAEIFSL